MKAITVFILAYGHELPIITEGLDSNPDFLKLMF